MIMPVSLLAAAGESNSPSVLPYDGMPTTCRDAVQHSLEDYFRIQSGEQEVFAEIEYVFLDPSRSQDDRDPSYCVWARVANRDAKKYRTGAAHVVTTPESVCVVTGFVPKKDFLAAPKRAARNFPPALFQKLLSIARTPQK